MEKIYGTDTGKAFQPVFAGTDDCNFIFLPCFCGVAEDTEVFYDASWQECSKDEASYEIVIRVEPDGKLLHGTFTVQRLSGEQPEEIYSVETDRMTGTERE